MSAHDFYCCLSSWQDSAILTRSAHQMLDAILTSNAPLEFNIFGLFLSDFLYVFHFISFSICLFVYLLVYMLFIEHTIRSMFISCFLYVTRSLHYYCLCKSELNQVDIFQTYYHSTLHSWENQSAIFGYKYNIDINTQIHKHIDKYVV